MDKIPLHKIISRVKDYLDTPITEEELLQKLITTENMDKKIKPNTSEEKVDHNKERLIILQALLALFSKDYETDLQKAVSVENELARKLCDLQFASKENKLLFVQGKCSKEEQEMICGKIFKALNFVIAAEEAELLGVPRIILHEDDIQQEEQLKNSRLKLKKTRRNFDLEQARKTLYECKQLILKFNSFEEKDSMHKPLDAAKKDYEVIVDEADVSEIGRLSKLSETKLKCGLLSPDHDKENRMVLSSQLGSAVEQLHPRLLSINNVITQSAKRKPASNPSCNSVKMLASVKEMRKESVISKCLTPGLFLP